MYTQFLSLFCTCVGGVQHPHIHSPQNQNHWLYLFVSLVPLPVFCTCVVGVQPSPDAQSTESESLAVLLVPWSVFILYLCRSCTAIHSPQNQDYWLYSWYPDQSVFCTFVVGVQHSTDFLLRIRLMAVLVGFSWHLYLISLYSVLVEEVYTVQHTQIHSPQVFPSILPVFILYLLRGCTAYTDPQSTGLDQWLYL